tara:strand:+ start:73 stop:285 length:213 start_codon:yes stop_codon:yes gene_type:complete
MMHLLSERPSRLFAYLRRIDPSVGERDRHRFTVSGAQTGPLDKSLLVSAILLALSRTKKRRKPPTRCPTR